MILNLIKICPKLNSTSYSIDAVLFKHPEVNNIGLLMLLYAEITLYLNYSILNEIVKIFKLKSVSAGNESSETLRNSSNENIKKISIHVPTHIKPLNNEQFGYYLAGLIEGNGHFSKTFQLIIVFHKLDISLAYYIKSYIGYGTIKKIKNKNAYIYVLSHKKGIEKVLLLINNKIKSEYKYNQIKKNITINFNKTSNPYDFNNHWLSGFSDADASFQTNMKILDINKKEVKLNYQIDLKDREILDLIKFNFGGNIGYYKLNNTWYYQSTSFGCAKKIINYFDNYHLLSSKYLNYIKWRKTYILIQDKKDLTNEGIMKYKNSMKILE